MINAYCRVSSRAQDLGMQRLAIERAAKAAGHEIVEWIEEKCSGRSIARSELERLRSEIRAGRVKRLYVFKIDRLSRSGIRDVFELIEEMRAHGCELITVADGFTLNGPAADVILAVMAWAAKMERQAINERIAAARDRMESEGRSWGRPSRLSTANREQISKLRADGRSIRQIAMALKIPRATIARATK